MRALVIAFVLAALFPISAIAQESVGIRGSITSALKDPTTWAPAGIAIIAKSGDWHSSQPIFAMGAGEMNPRYTISGVPGSSPVSPGRGYWINARDSSLLLAASFTHNATAYSIERYAASRWPTHRRLIRILGWTERIGFAIGGTYIASANNWRQWQRNRSLIAACSKPNVNCVAPIH